MNPSSSTPDTPRPPTRRTDTPHKVRVKTPMNPSRAPESFDVTCVIGSVALSEKGGQRSAQDAAFLLISQHGADGVYSFPNAHGGTTFVTVETVAGRPPS